MESLMEAACSGAPPGDGVVMVLGEPAQAANNTTETARTTQLKHVRITISSLANENTRNPAGLLSWASSAQRFAMPGVTILR